MLTFSSSVLSTDGTMLIPLQVDVVIHIHWQ
ncbi:hypothetical protein T03_929 [Trichinella britovi]|uniref:Uncharacterized protein n=1 Tax=Trichinella britovi TaxID=45882 RepID=A0A0V0ZPA3_TRIBR|nr:hypothetical protein T03_929 [Trichinella britovi]